VSHRPAVSVALATFNGSQYLREQLDTIYGQTQPPDEVVASDDASTDGTRELLEEYRGRFGLRILEGEQRQGFIRNFARAIGECRGDLIALSDQDDLWKPHKLQRLVAAIGSADLAYCNTQEYLTRGGSVAFDERSSRHFAFARLHGSGKPVRSLLAENWVASHSLIFRGDLRGQALPVPAHQPFHDGWLALVAATRNGIVYVDESLQIYRHHPASLTFREYGRDLRRWKRLRRLFTAELAETWAARCRAETARITDALGRLPLTNDELGFAHQLLRYYQGKPRIDHVASSIVAGWHVAPWFSSLHHTHQRGWFAMRGALSLFV
jgi:glycosyltransferase involved in cell wall biosynthesis